MSSAQAKDGGAAHSIASSDGAGSSLSNSVTKGGGASRSDAMAEHGESVANGKIFTEY